MARRTLRWLARLLAAAAIISGGAASAIAGNIELPVPKISIYPGDVITADQLEKRLFGPAAEQWPVIRSLDAAIGKVARRTLVAGKPIPAAYLRDADVVRQGKPVRIVYTDGPLTISAVAMPLQSGGVGDVLSLRNIESGVIIKGVVDADGTVRITTP
jgi:flagella basal body P-ring formation protein FlgA